MNDQQEIYAQWAAKQEAKHGRIEITRLPATPGMTLEECREHIGRQVIYTAPHGATEAGVITSVGEFWCFVRYGSNQHSKATCPAELTLAIPEGLTS